MFDGQSDESPSVREKPSSDCMGGRRNQHKAESKPSIVERFTRANGCGEQIDVTEEVESIDHTEDHDLRLHDVKYA